MNRYEKELIRLAAKLLTPGEFNWKTWQDERIRWHRLHGDNALADRLERAGPYPGDGTLPLHVTHRNVAPGVWLPR